MNEAAMIAQTADDITAAVLAEAARTPDARLRTLLQAAITHLHGFVRDSGLTEAEFQRLCGLIARAGQATNAAHNEVVLAAGSLGVSALVCRLNNTVASDPAAPPSATPAPLTTANLMGPFWRAGAPNLPHGASLLRGPTPGTPLFVRAWVRDLQGRPVAGAEVDVWHASAEGWYENQDPGQPDMNLRGRFVTDGQGHLHFRSIRPAPYPVPVDGPVGELLRAQGRHNMRPAHVHFLITAPGFKAQFAQVYDADDPYLDTDVQFGVTRPLLGQYVMHAAAGPAEAAPAADIDGPWCTLDHHFVIQPGEPLLPPPPIRGKTDGPRPARVVLTRREP
jgi:catechol 1,2-dioxygenase